MKLAHISDLHLTTLFRRNNLPEIEYALQYIRDLEVDHLAVTGDLTNNADEEDFLLIRNLFYKYNLLNYKKLSLIIGNHDIFGGIQTADDIFTFTDKCKNVNYKEKLNQFYNFFPEVFENDFNNFKKIYILL